MRIYLVAFLLLLAFGATGHAQIALVNASDQGDNNSAAGAFNTSYTVGTGPNRLLVVAVMNITYGGGPGPDGISVTYGGTGLTFCNGSIGLSLDAGNGNTSQVTMLYLLNPPSGSNTLSISDVAGTVYLQAFAADYINVKQAGQPDSCQTAIDSVLANTFSASYTTVNNGALGVVMAVSTGDSVPCTTTPTTSGSYTAIAHEAHYCNAVLAQDTPISPAGSTTVTATVGTSGGQTKQVQTFASFVAVPTTSGELMMQGCCN